MGRRSDRCARYVLTYSAWFLLTSSRADAHARQFVAITYEVDPTTKACPNVTEFRATLAQQLGHDPYRANSPSGVLVRVRSTETGIEGTVDWSTAAEKHEGERRFAARSDECRKMIAAIAFVVAVQIQLMGAEKASELDADALAADSTTTDDSPRGSDPVRHDVTKVATATLTLRSFEVRPRASLEATSRRIIAGLGPSVGFGLAPRPVVLGRLFGAVRLGWVGLEAGVEQGLHTRTTETYGAGFESVLTLGTLAACGWHGSLSACGLTKLGRIRVDGFGLDRPASPAGFVAHVGPRVGYALWLGDHLFLLGRVEALYSLTPWTVEINHEAVWNTPRLSAVAGIDLATGFP